LNYDAIMADTTAATGGTAPVQRKSSELPSLPRAARWPFFENSSKLEIDIIFRNCCGVDSNTILRTSPEPANNGL